MSTSADKKHRSVAMIGATLWGNCGAEAMIVSTMGEIRKRRPGTRFVLLSYFPKRDRELSQDSNLEVVAARPRDLVFIHFPFALLAGFLRLLRIKAPDWMIPASLRRLRDASVLVDLMGISFSDSRIKFLPFNVLSNLPAMLVGTPVVRLSQAMGPFKKMLNRVTARFILKRCRHVFARGSSTAINVAELKLDPERWSTAADLAFLYDPSYSVTDVNPDKVDRLCNQIQSQRDAGRLIVAVGPSMVVQKKFARSNRDYIEYMSNIVSHLLDSGHTVVLIPNAMREGTEKTNNNDLPLIRSLSQHLQRTRPDQAAAQLLCVDFDADTAGTRKIIGDCDVILTSRFHAMIAALCLHVPVLVLGWSHKYDEVLKEFGLADYSVGFDEPDADLIQLMVKLIEQRETVKAQIADNLERVRESSSSQFHVFDELLQ